MIALFIYTVSLITIIATSAVVVKNVSMLQSMKNENIRYKDILDSQNSSTMSHIQGVIAQHKQNDEKIRRAHLDAQRNVQSVKASTTQQMANLHQDLNTFRYNDRTYKEKLGDRISEMSNIHAQDIETYTRFTQREVDNRFQAYSNLPHFLHHLKYRSTPNGNVFAAQDFESINVDMPNDSLWNINNDLSNSLSYISSTFADRLSENAQLIENIYSRHRTNVADICGNLMELNSNINNYQSSLAVAKNDLTRDITQEQTDLRNSVTSNYDSKYAAYKVSLSNSFGLGSCDSYKTQPFDRAYDVVVRNCAGSLIGDVMESIATQSESYTSNIEGDISREFESAQCNLNTISRTVNNLDDSVISFSSATESNVRGKVSNFEQNLLELRGVNMSNQALLSDLLSSSSNYQEKKNIYSAFVGMNTSSAYPTVQSALNRAKTMPWTATDFCNGVDLAPGCNLCLSDVKRKADILDSNARIVDTYSFLGDRGPVISSDSRLVFESTSDGSEKASLSYEKQGTTEHNYLDGTINISGRLFIQGSEFNLQESQQKLNRIQSNVRDDIYARSRFIDSNLNQKSSNIHRHSQYASISSVESLNYNYNQWLNQPFTLYQESAMFSSSNISKFGFDNMGLTQPNRKVFGAEESVNNKRIMFKNTDILPNNVFRRGECVIDSIPSSNIAWGTYQVPNNVFRYTPSSVSSNLLRQVTMTDVAEQAARSNIISKIQVVTRTPNSLVNVNMSDVAQGNISSLQVTNVPANKVTFSTTNTLSMTSLETINVRNLNITQTAKPRLGQAMNYKYASNTNVPAGRANQALFCDTSTTGECRSTNIILMDNPATNTTFDVTVDGQKYSMTVQR
jgi:hypothetical protein